MNRTDINACPLVSSIASVREKPNFYNQKKQLPVIKKDLVKVFHSGELLDFKWVDSTVLQEVSKRVEASFDRFLAGDSFSLKSGKPRFKTEADFKTMTFATANQDWIKLVRKNWMYLRLPKLGVIKIRMHRALPEGFELKQCSITHKADGWFIQMILENKDVPVSTLDESFPTWENSMGMDAVLMADDGTFLPNGQSSKSGLNKSWNDAAFGDFFKTLEYIAEKAGSVVLTKYPAYTSMLLSYRNEMVFTDCGIREYWDEQESLMVDRDINAAINLKRLGLDIFPSIKRRSEKPIIVGTMRNCITKEILTILNRTKDSYTISERLV